MERVKLALIGAGNMANRVHYPSLAEFEDVELVGLCDLVPDKLRETAERFRIDRTFSDYRAMIENTAPDAVYVLMPPHHMFDIVVHCLQQGLGVFVEKPPALTLHQAISMARLAEQKGCKSMVGFNRRFIPLLAQVKRLVLEKGPIIQCVSVFHKSAPEALYYGGAVDVLTCDAIHAVDLLRWMGGEVEAIATDINRFCSERENSFNSVLRFKGGASGVLMANWAAGTRIHIFEMHARGISSYVDPDPGGKAILLEGDKRREITTEEAAGSSDHHKTYGFYGENRHFIDCLREDRQPETSFSDAVKTMELVGRMYASRIA